jgi:putative N-acetyltransferase (TIGR04045 family)
MRETVDFWGQRVAPFVSPVVTAQIPSEPWQIAAYYQLRRDIFVGEQGLFDGSDSDRHDSAAIPIVALAHVAGAPDAVVGVVRIYDTDGGVWFGGRLGVCAAYRARRSVGSALIFAAVASARALGCVEFLATVQLPNVRYFEHHHFAPVEPISVCGQPHWLMLADLGAYPAQLASSAQPVDRHALGRIARRRVA